MSLHLNTLMQKQPGIQNMLSSVHLKYDTLIKTCWRKQETALQPIGYKSSKNLLGQTLDEH